MKLIIILSLFMVSMAQANSGFYCIPSLKQTGFQVVTDGKNITVRVTNPKGYDFMPQFEGPVAPQTVPLQKMQYEDLKSLGDSFTVQWPASSCQLDHVNKVIDCDGPASKKISDIESNLLSTTQITEKSRGQSYNKQKYRFTFTKDGNFYFVALEFYDLNCRSFEDSTKASQRN